MDRVGIVDYGMGNLRSVANAIRAVAGDPHVISDPSLLVRYDRIILPGVGAFSVAINHLRSTGMIDALESIKNRGIPILGICLGMQLFCLSSEEDGLHEGLGWIKARVTRFPRVPGLKVPHMGWDNITCQHNHALIKNILDSTDFYFVHSFYVNCTDERDVLLSGNYGIPYCAMFARDNVAGLQFHPEKSQRFGLTLLKNFLEWTPC